MTKKYLPLLSIIVVLGLMLAACAPAAQPTAAPVEEAAPAEQAEAPEEAPAVEEAPAEEAAPAEESAETSVLNIAIGTNIDSFDPHGISSFAVANVIDYMVETLVNADENGDLIPALAENWEVSEDGLEYTFYLVQNATFSDGTPFNAEAVKANVERFLDEDVKTAGKVPYNHIQEVVVVDDYTVKFLADGPSSELLLSLSNTNIGMLSPQQIAPGTELYTSLGTTEPIGTGPYVMKEYVADDHVTVTRNANYWGEPPFYDEVNFRIVPDAATRESLMLAGQVDMAVLPPLTDLPALEANPDVQVIKAATNRIIYIGINVTNDYLNDPKVRQAMNYAVDQDAIVEKVLWGNAKPLVSPMPEAFYGFCETEPYYAYNPDMARELLAEAGVPEGFTVKFISPTGRYAQDYQVSQAIAGYLEDVGITVELSTTDWGSYMGQVMAPAEESDYDLYLLGWAGGYPHGSHTMTVLKTGNPFNGGFYSNPEVDELSALADAASDYEEGESIYCDVNQVIWDDAPWIFLYQQDYQVIAKPDLTNIKILPSEKFDALYARPAE